MLTTADTFAALPPVLRALAHRHGMSPGAVRSDGSLSLTIDQRYRIRLRPAPHNRVALSSPLLTLPPPDDPRCDQAIQRLLKIAAGMLREHASTLCLDARQQSLQLQQMVPASADAAAMEEALADFSNALAFWTKLCRAEAFTLQEV